VILKENIPNNLIIPKFMGLGSIHNTKEFFNLKAKFFKHLVKSRCENFIMEESYQAESGINEWISGGKGIYENDAKFLI
jgi:erythromycin esterase